MDSSGGGKARRKVAPSSVYAHKYTRMHVAEKRATEGKCAHKMEIKEGRKVRKEKEGKERVKGK